MNSHRNHLFIIGIIFSIVFAACTFSGQSPSSIRATATEDTPPTSELPTASPTAFPTNTSTITLSPTPSETPIPTATIPAGFAEIYTDPGAKNYTVLYDTAKWIELDSEKFSTSDSNVGYPLLMHNSLQNCFIHLPLARGLPPGVARHQKEIKGTKWIVLDHVFYQSKYGNFYLPDAGEKCRTAQETVLATARKTGRRGFPTETPLPTATLEFDPNQTTPTPHMACGNFETRLWIPGFAYVSLDPPLPNRVRSMPGREAATIGQIQPGEVVKVLEGPVCANGWTWWYIVSKETGLMGYTAEGNGQDYWVLPCPKFDRECGNE